MTVPEILPATCAEASDEPINRATIATPTALQVFFSLNETISLRLMGDDSKIPPSIVVQRNISAAEEFLNFSLESGFETVRWTARDAPAAGEAVEETT